VTVVVDSSITLAWLLPDEDRDLADAVLEQVQEYGAWVPALWHLEVANVLQVSVRRKRITQAVSDRMLSGLGALPFDVDMETCRHAWGRTRALAIRHGLTVYDAAYLELADRLGLPLATLDTELRRAATEQGVPLFGAS
jgi:predicted nucleic acid-binding protein